MQGQVSDHISNIGSHWSLLTNMPRKEHDWSEKKKVRTLLFQIISFYEKHKVPKDQQNSLRVIKSK